MRHRKAGYKLNRTTAHRTAMVRNMAASLFEHGQIVTTRPKAKAVQPFVERIITKAKRGDLHARRQVIAMLGRDRHAFEWLHVPRGASDDERERVERLRERVEGFFPIPDSSEVERNRYGELRKAPKLVKHIFENVAPRFEDRAGGYTRIIKLGHRRLGDQAESVLLQFVGNEEGPEIGGGQSARRRQADRRATYSAQLRKQRTSPAQPASADATATAEPPDEAQTDQASDAEASDS